MLNVTHGTLDVKNKSMGEIVQVFPYFLV